MRTKLYDYQDKTAEDIYNRMCNKELKGAYLGFQTGVRENSNIVICSGTFI